MAKSKRVTSFISEKEYDRILKLTIKNKTTISKTVKSLLTN